MNQTEKQKVSVFKDAYSTESENITISDYFKGIIEGKWQDEVLQYRAGKKEKKKITSVTASGFFSGRSDSDLIEHSGLLVIDIDDKDQELSIKSIRNSIKEIPEIFAIHASLGGKGLAIYFRIKKDKHFESFEAIVKILSNDYGIIPDMHCSNIGRLRFVSYDPECYINSGASVWNLFEKKEKRINEYEYDNFVFSDSDIDHIVKQIKERQIDIAPDYYSWIRIGFALASKFGESGRGYYRIISAYYSGKQKVDPDKQYDNCLKSDNRKSGGISIKSLFYFAKQSGCNLVSERTQKIKTVARIRRKQEQNSSSGSIVNGKQDAIKYLDEFEGITGKDVDEILEQVWKIPAKELEQEEGLLYDIEIFLKSNYTFRLNEITNIVEVDGVAMNDYIFNTIYLRCCRIVSDKSNKDKIFDLIHSDFTPKYNPILEWFEKNKQSKSRGNITELAKCITSNLTDRDSEFIEYFIEKWLISIIASAHGIFSILCLVLTGQEHGTGKTNFFRELLPDELRWLFATNKLDGKEADVGQLMCSKLLILDDEFGGKSKQDEKRFKELIGKDRFSIRKPYGRYFEDMQRMAVLCGTTNEEHIINDLTGNRRIIPIQVNYINEKAYSNIDKTLLFVELYWKFRENQKGWFLTKEDIRRLNEVCYDSLQVAAESELPLKYFIPSNFTNPLAKFVSSSEIRSVVEQRSGIRLSQQKLSIALKNLGFENTRERIDGNQIRGFYVIEKVYITDILPENNKNNNKNTTDELPF